MSILEDLENAEARESLEEIREQVKQDMELWSTVGPESPFKSGFDTAVRKYAEILGLLDAPLYEDWEDANGNR